MERIFWQIGEVEFEVEELNIEDVKKAIRNLKITRGLELMEYIPN